jgi:hypothetical protein
VRSTGSEVLQLLRHPVRRQAVAASQVRVALEHRVDQAAEPLLGFGVAGAEVALHPLDHLAELRIRLEEPPHLLGVAERSAGAKLLEQGVEVGPRL